MASLGSFLLLATFVVCSYAAVASVVGARRGSRRLIESGIGAFYLIAALMTVASAVMINAFLTHDFSIKYVARLLEHASSRCSTRSPRTGAASTARSCSGCSCCRSSDRSRSYVNRERHRDMIPYVVAIITVVQMFFLFLMIFHKNPFATYLTRGAGRRRGAEPAAPELLDGDPSAVALHGLRRA